MKKPMLFFVPEDASGGGGGVMTPSSGDGTVSHEPAPTKGLEVFSPAKSSAGDRPLPEEKVISKSIEQNDPQRSGPSGAGTGEGDGVKTPKPFDPEKFAKDFGESIGKSFATKVEGTAPRKELSPEEARKMLNFWEPDEGWYKKFDNLETRNSAVSEMRDGLIKQADTIAQLRMHELVDALRGEIDPQLKSIGEFTRQQRENRFGEAYPVLAKPELKPLITAIASDMVSKGQKFDSEAEMFKAVASGVEAVIKVTNPNFALTAGSSPAKSPSRSNNSIPTTSPGSGAGGGSAPQKAETKRGLAIFS